MRRVRQVRRMSSRKDRGSSPRDRGSVSLWVVMFAFITMILLTLVVDGGQLMITKSRAADIAEQAARASADDIAPASLRSGGQPQLAGDACDLQNGPAVSLVQDYGNGVGVNAKLEGCQPGTDVEGTPDVTVQVQVSMQPIIPAPGFTGLSVTATETAYLACGSADQVTAC